ncbi:glycerophosphodiester phosphodiesterase [Ornithinibacillus bavariensis]|uniref:GP-PDE domain-containing protein n=1 Tax=Ornithinibacillus bavariensis TaxID=545502 RepID=A0A919X612_9BACI|nr:glycerophosphodiester phosphodiesterase family protein [Ornithinibacillus bavariensis]GIO26389.1 hypothetical protein J43TS3_10000 [Ornithinibacillus bavariensis]
MEITANVADEAKVTANEAKEVTQQLIDGSFDTGELNTHIKQRLNNLETEYAPRLSEAEQGIRDNRKYIDEQLDAQQQEIEEVENKTERTKLVDLEEPLYICHRGAIIFPENTLEAYKGCLAVGNSFIEMDVQTLADGSLGVMHDLTVDWTTDKDGSVSNYSAMGFRNLNVDIPSWVQKCECSIVRRYCFYIWKISNLLFGIKR